MPDPTAKPTDATQAILDRYEPAADPASTPAEPEPAADPAPKPADHPPSTPASVAVADAPKHPASLVKRARKLGFDDDDLADLDTDDLRDAVSERAAARLAEEAATRAINAAGRPIDPATGRYVPQTQAAPEAPKADEFSLGMTAADLEAAGVAGELHPVLQKLLAPLHAEIRALKADRDQLVTAERGRRTQEGLNALDRLFTKHPGLYGDGTLDDLDPASREWKLRQRVIRDLSAIPHAERGRTLAEDFKKVHADLSSLVGEAPKPKPATPAEPEPEPAANGHVNRIGDKFANGHAIKPTDRPAPKEPKGRKRAEEAVARIQREREADEEDDRETLPD